MNPRRQIIHYTGTGIHLTVAAVRNWLGDKAYILLLSILVGLISGLAAVGLKHISHAIHLLSLYLENTHAEWIAPALPFLGILICVCLVRLCCRDSYDKSLACVITATSNGTSNIPPQKMYSHLITSGICVGFGGSAGLEAPIALTGSAIGSNVGKFLRTGIETRTLLLACGGGAGISAIFNSPVAGALFACEILLPAFSIPALVPLLMASATAAVVSEALYLKHPIMEVTSDWNKGNILFYIVLGLLAGLISAYTIRMSINLGKKMTFLRNVWIKAILGGAVLYVMFLFLPALKGEGYGYIGSLVAHQDGAIMQGSPLAGLIQPGSWFFLGVCLVLVLLKVISSVVTLESGGDGGIFAPSMFIGALTGFCLARFINMIELTHKVSEVNFIAVGMGGVLAGVMHAPMTGMFLIAEMTGGYKLFIPLMIVASLSCFISKLIAKYNVYKSAIVERGGVPEPNQSAVLLDKVTLDTVLEKDFIPISSTNNLRGVLKVVMESKRNVFPVLNEDRTLAGVVTVDDVRPFLLDSTLYDIVLVYDLMSVSGPVLSSQDTLASALRVFESSGCWLIPVLRDGKYLGFVSKAGVFEKYRELLRNKRELF